VCEEWSGYEEFGFVGEVEVSFMPEGGGGGGAVCVCVCVDC